MSLRQYRKGLPKKSRGSKKSVRKYRSEISIKDLQQRIDQMTLTANSVVGSQGAANTQLQQWIAQLMQQLRALYPLVSHNQLQAGQCQTLCATLQATMQSIRQEILDLQEVVKGHNERLERHNERLERHRKDFGIHNERLNRHRDDIEKLERKRPH